MDLMAATMARARPAGLPGVRRPPLLLASQRWRLLSDAPRRQRRMLGCQAGLGGLHGLGRGLPAGQLLPPGDHSLSEEEAAHLAAPKVRGPCLMWLVCCKCLLLVPAVSGCGGVPHAGGRPDHPLALMLSHPPHCPTAGRRGPFALAGSHEEAEQPGRAARAAQVSGRAAGVDEGGSAVLPCRGTLPALHRPACLRHSVPALLAASWGRGVVGHARPEPEAASSPC